MLRAGFSAVEITPSIGTSKIGWLVNIVSDSVRDPLYARAAVFGNDESTIAVLAVDTLSIRWTHVNEIRRRVEAQFGLPGAHLLVAATHNHAGPAVANLGEVTRDEQYIACFLDRCVEAVGQALANAEPAEIGFGHTYNFAVGHNRRVVLRDGTTRTHGNFGQPDSLCLEGPIDPEVAVLGARSQKRKWLGCLVNYACHPTEHGGDGVLSAGYPGALVRNLQAWGCPQALFVNGACGNISTAVPELITGGMSIEEAGASLAKDATQVLSAMTFRQQANFNARSVTVQLPYRTVSDDEMHGTIRGAQRFSSTEVYEHTMPALMERIRQRGTQPVEVQALSIDEIDLVGIPAEYFVEHGLRIKESVYPRRALIASCTNGMVGYLPTRQAMQRGGYETTFSAAHRMAPEAGDIITDAAIELVNSACKV